MLHGDCGDEVNDGTTKTEVAVSIGGGIGLSGIGVTVA